MTQLSHTRTWHEDYDAAISETDKHRLWMRIEVAESVIRIRRDEIREGPEHEAEREAIAEALSVLETLKRKRLGFLKPFPPDFAV